MLMPAGGRGASPGGSRGQARLTGAADWELEIARLERRAARRGERGAGSGRLPGARRGKVSLPGPAAAARRNAAAGQLSRGAAALSLSVLADSAMEHYRGGFYNPAMYLAPIVSAITLGASGSAARSRVRTNRARDAAFTAAVLTGLVGFGFHTLHTTRRIGGWTWDNLFYGPPIAAPLGLSSAGLLGLASSRIRSRALARERPTLLGFPAGVPIAMAASAGLLGTAAEAGVLHFRGAFHHPAMYLPVSVAPLAALALAGAALRPTLARRRLARVLLRATAAAGIAGTGFHAYGVRRSMGGWRNWSQNLLAGPPLPAPPSFTGMALAGLASLTLLEERVP